MHNLLYVIIIFTSSVFVYPFQVSAYDFTRINLNYKYDPNAELTLRHRIASNDTLATIFLKVRLNQFSNLEENYSLVYGFQKNYADKSHVNTDSLDVDRYLIKNDENIYYLKFEVSIPRGNELLVLDIRNRKTKASFIYDVPLKSDTNFPYTDLIIMDKTGDVPLFRNYLHKDETFRIVSVYQLSNKAYLYQYRKDFAPAAPPMAENRLKVDKSLSIDSLFGISLNKPISFNEESLYFTQTDTSTLHGISFRITGPYFPKYARVEDIVQPLIYISTSTELKRINRATDKKRALDKFWLDVTRSSTRAKIIIKRFYNQTELANKYFTTYKPGWKTDHGMIYMLYGPPAEVYVNELQEEWVYDKEDNFSKIRFTFVKIKNIFTNDHYELLRNSDYDKHWFRTVDLWRKGRKEI